MTQQTFKCWPTSYEQAKNVQRRTGKKQLPNISKPNRGNRWRGRIKIENETFEKNLKTEKEAHDYIQSVCAEWRIKHIM